MGNASHADGPQHRRSSAFLLTVAIFVLFSGQVRSQTASTGALTGLVLDPAVFYGLQSACSYMRRTARSVVGHYFEVENFEFGKQLDGIHKDRVSPAACNVHFACLNEYVNRM